MVKREPYRCRHSFYCDCYCHCVVALHIATTAPLRGGDNNHNKHSGGSDMVLASLYHTFHVNQFSAAVSTTFHMMLSMYLTEIDMLSMYVKN